MAIDVARGAAKMVERMDSAGWLGSIMRLTEAPNAKAARSGAAYKTGTSAAVDSGRYQQRNQSVTLGAYQTACTAKQTHYAESAQRAADHWTAVQNAGLAQAQDQVVTSVRAMPNASQAQRKARMNANFDAMAKLAGKYSYKGLRTA